MLRLVLLVFALVFFLLATVNMNHPRVQFGWLGLACLTGAQFVGMH